MVIASYMAGQKFYHVDYRLAPALAYIAAALLIYFFSNYLRHAFDYSLAVIVFFNTALLILFIAGIWLIERRKKTYLRQP